ncbi:FKBP-type peptidyl-prolyl cis-trans isomerase [Modestobacter sp. DSM 44400]|uniref:FKBP-type peptidyl-prolyl cis-trans isomerase n=1 Tax=Modestobacter sp. DSM 44400 TaxID=1550230 RepID=UPI00089D1E87|nr:FKBP-type peptidyl-prolyl cis-trans isomerase [Modestobacter sp. DSM 44400]SDY15810.1 FKBP-type peptidyl-prolyl cis-trans isomerase [Modestobacter sp. DSM 44400]
MIRRTAPRALLALLVAASLAACGGSDEESPTATAEPAAGISTDLSVAPEVPPADAPPPGDLQVSDIVVGSGPEAVDGATVAVKYVGAFYETGEQFDSSWRRGADETLPVTLGAGQVIPGFEQAITGMRVGGRRLVVIPSDLGYGAQGQGPIPGGATLVFVLDLVEVGV